MAKVNLTPPSLTPEQIARFWSLVDRSPGQGPKGECWEYKGAHSKRGYGRISIGSRNHSRTFTASRLSFFFTYNKWLEFNACHRCDNPPCCRPDHLFEGTHADNIADCVAKGRNAKGDRNGSRLHPERVARGTRQGTHTHPETVRRGVKHGNAKFTEEDVLAIRAQYGKVSQNQLAIQHNVTRQAIWHIVHRKVWQHI